MKTRDLIALLAIDAIPVERHATARRYAVALICGASGATLMMLGAFGVRAGLQEAALLPMFLMKLQIAAGIAASGLQAAARLSRPGVRVALAPAFYAAPLLVVWGMAVWELVEARMSERADLVLGMTWDRVPFNIFFLSIPALAAAFWAMRGLAPVRLVLAGAAAGLFAGGIGAIAYSFHCDEIAAPFIGIWYPAGVLLPVVVGAVLGPVLLRW